MTLKDADEIVKALDEAVKERTDIMDALRKQLLVGFVKQILNDTPTVEAIPIEWILKWACEFVNPNSEGYKMAMELVHDWEKENEID